jgi:hypothetical protein
MRNRPLGYEALAGCPVGCSLGVLVPLDLGKRLPVLSFHTGSSHLLAAGLGDKTSDKSRLRHQLARGARPVLGDHLPRWQAANAARQPVGVCGSRDAGFCHDAVVLSVAGHARRPPSRRVVWWALILAGVLVLLVIVRAAGTSDASALARRPVVVRHLDHSLVSLGSHPRTYVDPAATCIRSCRCAHGDSKHRMGSWFV